MEQGYNETMEGKIQGHRVQWDDVKNEINKKKHGISLEAASYVFTDPNRKEFFDELHSDEEDRYRVIGCIGKIVFVVYTERGDASRLISARFANARERRAYYGNS